MVLKKLAGIVALAAICMLSMLYSTAFAEEQTSVNDFNTIIERRRAELVGVDNDMSNESVLLVVKDKENKSEKAWESMVKAPDREVLWEGELLDKYTTGSGIHNSFNKLRDMAAGYKMHGSKLFGNEELKQDIIDGLDFLNRKIYFEGDSYSRTGQLNWFYWEISIPQNITDTLCMMYDEIPQDLRERLCRACLHYAPRAAYQGFAADTKAVSSNLIWKCSNHILLGALLGEEKYIEEGKVGLEENFWYIDEIEKDEGFKTDGSFIMHIAFPYAGGYGKDSYSSLVAVFSLVEGTKYAYSQEYSDVVYDWTFKSFMPFIHNCSILDALRGRYVARQNATAYTGGLDIMRTMFKLAQNAPTDKKQRIYSFIKTNLSKNERYAQSFLKNISIELSKEAERMLSDESILTTEAEAFANYYAGQEVGLYNTEDFMFGVNTSSKRMMTYESINNENLHGWYQGHGATYIYNKEHEYYSKDYWCTVDPYKLAGTTVSDVERIDGYKTGYLSSKVWAGGATLDGEIAICGMELEDYKTEQEPNVLTAKKSWFMLDGQIVALGSGITNKNKTADNSTYVENRIITKDSALTIDGRKVGFGETVKASPKYIHYKGELDSIGYCFLDEQELELSSMECSGSWYDVRSSDGSKEIKTNPFMQIRIPHGVNPLDKSYAYVLMPSKSLEETAQYANNPTVEILENTPVAAAIKYAPLGVEAVNFWTDNNYTVGSITSDGEASVIMQKKNGELLIAIAEPTQLREEMIIEFDEQVAEALYLDEDIEVLQTEPTLKLRLNTHESLGYTFNAVFRMKDSARIVKMPYSMQGLKISAVKEGGKSCYINGAVIEDNIPVYCAGRLCVSPQYISKSLGVQINHNNGMIELSYMGKKLTLPLTNEQKENTAYICNDRVYLPMRYIAENLCDKKVYYSGGVVTVTDKDIIASEAAVEYLNILLQ